MINVKQCTIAWYVNGNKISHMDIKVLDEIHKKIETHFGKMKVRTGDKHVFLGMNLHFNKKDQVLEIDMID